MSQWFILGRAVICIALWLCLIVNYGTLVQVTWIWLIIGCDRGCCTISGTRTGFCMCKQYSLCTTCVHCYDPMGWLKLLDSIRHCRWSSVQLGISSFESILRQFISK
ncbi:hypothetical protein M758_5G182400 [Ceratodon purpureus]|nr:hypothetical protein M758_5G182400 [Ceratodon purpureus]